MQGFITEKQVMAEAEFIIESYGLDFWALCMLEAVNRSGITFLGCMMKYNRI